MKLTPDEEDEPPSAMHVVGAKSHFRYGPQAGAAGAFLARLYHSSVPPESEAGHLKLAFFFRESTKGERLAKRTAMQAVLACRGSDPSASSDDPMRHAAGGAGERSSSRKSHKPTPAEILEQGRLSVAADLLCTAGPVGHAP